MGEKAKAPRPASAPTTKPAAYLTVAVGTLVRSGEEMQGRPIQGRPANMAWISSCTPA
jgi:hypothetical protein